MYFSACAAANSAKSFPVPPAAAHRSFRTSRACRGSETQSCVRARFWLPNAPKNRTVPPTGRSPGSCLPIRAARTFRHFSVSAVPRRKARSSRALSLVRTRSVRKHQQSALRQQQAARNRQTDRQRMRPSGLGLASFSPPPPGDLAAGRLPDRKYRLHVEYQCHPYYSTEYTALIRRAHPYRALYRTSIFSPRALNGTILQFLAHPHPPHLILVRKLRSRMPVLPRVRRSVVHPARKVAHHHLSAADVRGKCSQHLNLVPLGRQFIARRRRNAVLHHHVAACKRKLRKPWRLQRRLNVHLEVRDVRDELRVRLRLIPSAHNAKCHSRLASLRESGNDGVARPLAPRQRIRRSAIQRKQRASIVQRESRSGCHDSRSKLRVITLDQRDHVSVAVHHAQIRRIASSGYFARSNLTVGMLRINQLCSFIRPFLRQQRRHRHFLPARISNVCRHVRVRQFLLLYY